MDFETKVLEVLSTLEVGEVVTYGEVAEQAGFPGASRAVGNLLRTTTVEVPWWRVVSAGGYIRSPQAPLQIEKLTSEGVSIVNRRVVEESSSAGEKPATPTMVELIGKKRDGGQFNRTEIGWILDGFVSGSIPDYQMAALAMAIVWQGLQTDELGAWTTEMLNSGQVLDLSNIDRPTVDKHSTGGVGDKISLPLAPLVAACGAAVPMMSGRGLGHTGGTLDKLESIPGFTVGLNPDTFKQVLADCGLVLAGQSESLVPADRKLYALRDATATVESIPLIASSICSKKLAEDLNALVLDVKVGSGAFMKDRESASELARTMVDICRQYGVAVTAYLTNMDQPLGTEVGNANEMKESLEVLAGGGPEDVVEEVLVLGSEMLVLTGITDSNESGRELLEQQRAEGGGTEVMAKVVAAQGGDPTVVENPDLLELAPHHWELEAEGEGVVRRCDAYQIGLAAVRLGAGRAKKEDSVDHGVGISVLAKIGDMVTDGQPLARISYRTQAQLEAALPYLRTAWEFTEEDVSKPDLINEKVGHTGL